jgi:hypothetical protein
MHIVIDQIRVKRLIDNNKNIYILYTILMIFILLNVTIAALLAPAIKLCPVKAIVIILYLFIVFTSPSKKERHGLRKQIQICAHILSGFFFDE